MIILRVLSCGHSKVRTLPQSSFKTNFVDDACPWNKIKPTSAVSMNTGSSEALARLTDWIQECTDSHEQCGRLLRSSQLPRRVVEILGPGQVRLRETNNEEARYVCLSHCWGTNEFICTTAATLAANKTSIPWDDLPRTFQDAIDMTWRLGIRHIWIDSLCILQVCSRPIQAVYKHLTVRLG
jgi:hypothetical protein